MRVARQGSNSPAAAPSLPRGVHRVGELPLGRFPLPTPGKGGTGTARGGCSPTSKDWKVKPTWKPSETVIFQMHTLLGR